MIPDNNHVAYYCSPSKLEDGLPSSEAFLPRWSVRYGAYEEHISVNHLEHFGDVGTACALRCIRDALLEKIELKPTGGIAVLNVGEVRRAGRKAGNEAIRVEERPIEGDPASDPPVLPDPSHAGIVGFECASRRVRGRTQLDLRTALVLQSLVKMDDMHRAVTADVEPQPVRVDG